MARCRAPLVADDRDGTVIHLTSLTKPASPSLRIGAALARDLPHWTVTRHPAGGLHLWVRLPDGVQDTTLADAARAHGVAVDAGTRYFPAEAPAPHLRLAFAAAPGPADLSAATRRLATMIG